MMSIATEALMVVITGEDDIEVSIPPAHSVIGFSHGLPQKHLPFPAETILTVERLNDSAWSDFALPVVLAVIRTANLGLWLGLDQHQCDHVHTTALRTWAQDTTAGRA